MEEPSPQDLVVVAVVVFLALIAFIAVLFLNRGPKARAAGTPNAKTPGEEGEAGTVFKEEGGKVVRRSTRQHKPVTPLGPRLAAAAADADTVTPKKGRTPSKTAADPVTPRSTRGRGRPPKAAEA